MINEEQINENIISILGIESLPDEKKINILKKLNELVQKRIALSILKKLDAGEKEKFVEATTNNNEVEIKAILDGNSIDMAGGVGGEVVKLKEEVKDKVEELGV